MIAPNASMSAHAKRHGMLRAAFNPSRADLGRRMALGVAWQFGLIGTRVGLTVLSTAILARLLTPTDYGLNGMAAIVVEIAALLTNLGFGPILIQKPRLARIDLDTAFWVSVGIGAVLALVLVAVAYPAALFFKQPELFSIICISGLNFVVQEANVVPAAILNRLLKFKAEVLIQLAQIIVRIALAILIAWAGGGYWSLVLAPLITGVLGTLFSLWYVGYLPRLRFSRGFVAQNWRASGSYLGSGLITHLMSNFDYMVVGRRFGAEQLGYYQTAFSLPEELRSRFAGPIQRILMPAFSLIQADVPAFRASFLRCIKLFASVMFPLGFGLAASAKYLVPLLYGGQWLAVIPLLQILAVGGALRAVVSLTSSVFSAKGVPELAFKIQLWTAPLVLGLILAGAFFGVAGVAWAMLTAQTTGLISVRFAMKELDAEFSDFVRAVLSPVLAAVFMFFILTQDMTDNVLAELDDAKALITLVASGASIYLLTWLVLEYRFALDALRACMTGFRPYCRPSSSGDDE